MLSPNTKPLPAVVLALLAIGVAGCSEPPAPEPSLFAEPQAIHVDKKTEMHTVQLDAKGRTTDLEKQRLDGFIADLGATRPDSLHVTIRGPQPELQLRNVAKLVVADGVDPAKIAIAPEAGKPSGHIVVTVDRYVAISAECPPWSTAPVAGNDNVASPNFGCANLNNFAAMVADPHDLIEGKSSRFTDGITGAAAINRYDQDKLKELPKRSEDFSVGAGGGGK